MYPWPYRTHPFESFVKHFKIFCTKPIGIIKTLSNPFKISVYQRIQPNIQKCPKSKLSSRVFECYELKTKKNLDKIFRNFYLPRGFLSWFKFVPIFSQNVKILEYFLSVHFRKPWSFYHRELTEITKRMKYFQKPR